MILIDCNQLIVSTLFANKEYSPDIDLLRHFVMNSIRSYRSEFCREYGEVVLCFDSPHSWRKDFFPHYKACRKKSEDLDWDKFFKILTQLVDEFRENLPYKVVKVDKCEGDDIIAVLAKYNSEQTSGTELFPNTKTLIISDDHDFVQLQQYSGVKQYSHMTKKFLTCDNPVLALRENIIRGEKKAGDGVPSIINPWDVFVLGVRQKALKTVEVEEWVKCDDPSKFCADDTMLSRWKQNETLIDLSKIPDVYQTKILEVYRNTEAAPRKKLMPYMMQHGMMLLMASITEF